MIEASAIGFPALSRMVPLTLHSGIGRCHDKRSTTLSSVTVVPAATVPGSLSRDSFPGHDQRTRNGPGGNSNRYAPSAPVVTVWPAPGPSVTVTGAPVTGPCGNEPWETYPSCMTTPWTTPVVAAGAGDGADEGAVGTCDPPQAVRVDISPTSTHS